MGIYKGKYATSEQIAEIERLAADGHHEALIAFGKDCVHGYKQNLERGCWIVLGIGFIVGLVRGVIEVTTEERKNSKEPEENIQNE